MTTTHARAKRAGNWLTAVGVIAVMFAVVAPTAGATVHPEHCGTATTSTSSTQNTGTVDHGNDNAPAGNNGTVKIDGCELDQGVGPSNDKPGNGDPDNEPHIGCLVTVDWYDYDEGELFSSVEFEVWPPTGGTEAITVPLTDHRAPGDAHAPFAGSSPFTSDNDVYIGEDPASGASAAGIDASVTYRMDQVLASFTPHPQHGWHVKLTVHADSSIGADVKHKVFWTGPCVTPTTTTTVAGGTTTTASTGTTTPAGSGTTTTAGIGATTTAPIEVAGTTVENTTTTTTAAVASVLGVQLARTGNDTRLMVLIGGLFLLLGGVALRAGAPNAD
jgi:hypothetical protein